MNFHDVRTYAGNLIYGVMLRVNVGDKLAKKNISLCCCLVLKNLEKWILYRMNTLEKMV